MSRNSALFLLYIICLGIIVSLKVIDMATDGALSGIFYDDEKPSVITRH